MKKQTTHQMRNAGIVSARGGTERQTERLKSGRLQSFQPSTVHRSLFTLFTLLTTLLLLAGTTRGATIVSAGSGYWTNAATWTGGVPASDSDVVIQSGHTITNTGTSQISINSLSITGTLTHVANAGTDANIINLQIGAGGLTIDMAGKINVSEKGRNTTAGGNGRIGGTHGGQGAAGNGTTTLGTPYGSITNPVTSGSCGQNSASASAGSGGGVVVINVTGSATIVGEIRADGKPILTGSAGGGAGGSINITANSILGGGTLSAAGGLGLDNAGGGGGGRIAVTTAGSDFGSLQMTAQGAATIYPAAAGTIYLKKSGDTYGTLLVDNKTVNADVGFIQSLPARTLPPSGVHQFDTIITTNFGVVVVGSGASLDLTGCKLRSNSTTNNIVSRLILGTAGSSVVWPSAWTNNGTISWIGSAQQTINCNLTIASGGILTHEAGSTHSVNLNLSGNLTVNSGGAIWVKNCGYGGASGPAGYAQSGSGRAGGAHGGQGGYAFSSYCATTYDSITNPVMPGGGGFYNAGSPFGGGVVIINASGAVTVDGVIDAGTVEVNFGSTGAGGSVNIRAGQLLGSGSVSVKGGDHTSDRGAGGGGRIAVVLTNEATFGSVTMTALGGRKASTTQSGAAGTIYLKGTNAPYGRLVIPATLDANAVVTTMVGPAVIDAVVGDVELQSGARLAVDATKVLQVYGNWTNAATSTVGGSGTVEFKGATTNTLYGSTVFPGFVCTNAGKGLQFQVNTTNTMLTKLNIAGASLNPVSLMPATAGQQWYIKATNTFSTDIKYVAVSNSTAVTNANGQKLTANYSTPTDVVVDNLVNSNTNWVFPAPQDRVWNGSVSSDWGTPDNWSPAPATVPQQTDLSITIPAVGYQPVLDISRTYDCPITISNGASLSLGGGVKTLTLNGALTNLGSIIATASETLICSKDVDFTGGSYTSATSTLKLNAAAAGSQTFKPGNCTFYRIEVPNAATVTFSDAGLTASQFSCRAGGAILNFKDGSTYTITDFDLRGSSSGATTNFVTLRSTSPGTKWNLTVTRLQTVRYVDAEDSDADGGLTIYAVNSVNTGSNNDNWNFGSGKAWAGGTSTDWGTAANWNPASVPGATDYVLIDGYYANAPTLGANTTNAGLVVGGYASNAVLTLNATLTVDGNAVVQPTYGKIKFTTDTAGGALNVGSNLTVFGTIECQRSSTAGNGAGRVISVGGNLMVASNALIDATGMGFAVGTGPGQGYRASAHGGECYAAEPNSKGTTYGSITQPTSLGSGAYTATNGGGAVRMNVGGLTTIESGALIRADAETGTQTGAGGSVWLTTGTLTGGGTIRAKGGDTGGPADGAGGGGRIAIVVTNGLYPGSLTVQAYGASNGGGNLDAAAGTIYLKGTNQSYGMLVVDNGNRGLTTASRTRIGSSVTDKTVGDVILRNAGYMAVSAGETLTVNGSWSNAVATNAISGGTVALAGTDPNPVSVWGGNTWSNLTIVTAGKIVQFEHSKTQTVYGIPAFSNVTLRSTLDNTQWHLRKPGIGTQYVGRVTVYDSHAGTAGSEYTFWGAVGSDVSDAENVNWNSTKPKGSVFLLR